MKEVFEGKWFTVKTNEEFREVLNEYSIDTKCFKNADTIEDFFKNCIEIRESCWYKTYFIQLDINNKNIYWIGLDEEEDSFGAVTLYKNENLKRSILCDVMTFSEATEKWGLGESTLRSTVRADRLVEGVDYRKSGKVWLITEKAMTRLYGESKERKMLNDINNIKITSSDEDEVQKKYFKELESIAKKYGYETNLYDFDNERIYKEGYEEKENWENEYICSVSYEIEEQEKSEDETLYVITARTF